MLRFLFDTVTASISNQCGTCWHQEVKSLFVVVNVFSRANSFSNVSQVSYRHKLEKYKTSETRWSLMKCQLSC
jgi:hypothetical protein